jgi:predicted permease
VRLWTILQRGLQSLLFRDRHESELSEELRLHLERETERLQATGLSHDEARTRARQQFGGVEQIKEAARDARGTAAWDALVRDTRHGLRRLVRDWRFTTAAVLILGIGIGANTAIFSLVNAALFRDQRLPDPERLVDIYENDAQGRPLMTSYAAYQAIAAQRDVFTSVMASFAPEPVSYRLAGAVRSGIAEHTTAAYLDVLGLRPALGRWFDDGEDRLGAPLIVVLGHQFWTRQFDADPSAIGRTISISGLPATIVGVAPAGHRGTINIGLVTDFWLPLAAIQSVQDIPLVTGDPIRANQPAFFVKARLKDGRTVAHAQAAIDIIARQRDAERPANERGPAGRGAAGRGSGIAVFASTDVRIHPQADTLLAALASVLLVVVGLVLAIASSNLATLLLVRGATRAKEVSVRLAMGATRRQIARHLLTESVLLSLGGGATGCVLAWWGVQWLRGVELPFTVDISLDLRVLAFALVLSVVTGVLFGLAPALRATRVDLLPTLRDEGTPPIDHRRLTLKNALIVFQLSLSVLLLGGTSVFLQMLAATRALPLGFAVDGVAAVVTDVRYAGHTGTAARNVYDELLRRVAAIPGVESASLLRGLPMEAAALPIVLEGQTSTSGQASMFEAGQGFHETMRIPLLFGRAFDARDQANSPRVAVISERMARQYFGAVNAVGRRFRLESDPNSWTEVIGVVRNTGTGSYSDDVLDPIPPPYYRPHTQSSSLPTTIIARTSRDTSALVVAMQRELRAFDITLPIMSAKTMAQVIEGRQEQPRAVATFLGVLGGLGLMLASIGLYAVVAFAVARRSREIGIRMALGARNRQVAWSVARGVAGLMGVGTGVGLFLSVLMMLAFRAAPSGDIGIGDVSFYRPEVDPVALVAIAGIMALVGVAAAFVPARRASRMDPLVALRHD